MKLCKKMVAIILTIAFLFALSISVFANNEIAPYYNNVADKETVFTINSDGLAEIRYVCKGFQGVTTRIEISSQIQKKTLWWWNDVDGGSYFFEKDSYECEFWHNKQLSKSGTYRLVVTYTVYGTGGAADVINSEVEASY